GARGAPAAGGRGASRPGAGRTGRGAAGRPRPVRVDRLRHHDHPGALGVRAQGTRRARAAAAAAGVLARALGSPHTPPGAWTPLPPRPGSRRRRPAGPHAEGAVPARALFPTSARCPPVRRRPRRTLPLLPRGERLARGDRALPGRGATTGHVSAATSGSGTT